MLITVLAATGREGGSAGAYGTRMPKTGYSCLQARILSADRPRDPAHQPKSVYGMRLRVACPARCRPCTGCCPVQWPIRASHTSAALSGGLHHDDRSTADHIGGGVGVIDVCRGPFQVQSRQIRVYGHGGDLAELVVEQGIGTHG